MSYKKISDLPPIKEFDSILEYVDMREEQQKGIGGLYSIVDLFQMIRILQNKNEELEKRLSKFETNIK